MRRCPHGGRRAILDAGLCSFLLLALPGCQLGYVVRQGMKELRIAWSAVEIDEDGKPASAELTLTPERTRKLKLVRQVKAFARDDLKLDVGDAYSTYYETGGRAISHIVSAAHPLALIPYRWSFPFVGAVTYKGYFERADAVEAAERLEGEGWDTFISEVSAYSTLGWFEDPVLSTMLDLRTGHLVELILHELTHRTVYFPDRTALNESLATAVGRAGARMFLTRRFGEDSEELSGYLEDLELEGWHKRIFHRLRQDLDALYRSSLPEKAKLRRKGELFSMASRTLAALYPGQPVPVIPPSNARVLARSQYLEHLPLLERVLETFDGQPHHLMAFLRELPDSTDPLEALEQLEKTRPGGTTKS